MAPRNAAKVTTISLKEATAVASPDKPKRHDVTFLRSTERGIVDRAGVADSDASTIPVSHSTVSLLTTHPVTPRIAATETIRARISSISSDVAEKRAKYLIESNTGSSSPSTLPSHNRTPDGSWSNLKTVGEVHHNNVTLGKSALPLNEDRTAGAVSGKLDIEEISEKTGSAERPSTQRNAAIVAADDDDEDGEHETQLQKSNSSRITDVQDDNSLSSLASASHRPVDVFVTTNKAGELRPVTIHHERSQNIPKLSTNNAENTTRRVTTLSYSSTRVSSSSSTSPTTEHVESDASETDEFLTTTEEENDFTTTIPMTNDDTTTPIVIDEMPTTLSQHDSTLTKTSAITTNENLMDDETTTIIIPTTESKYVFTTIPDEDNKIQPEQSTAHAVVPKETNKMMHSSSSSSTTARSALIRQPVSHVPKPIDMDKQRIVVISKDDARPEIVSTTEPPTTTWATEPNIAGNIPTPTPPSMTERLPEPMETTSTAPKTLAPSARPNLAGRIVPGTNNSPHPADHTEIAQLPDTDESTDVNAMIAMGISIVAVITLVLLVGFLYVMRKRQKQLTYSQRCRPIGLDAYSLDNISIYNSVRRKSAHRLSGKRAFGNAGFDDPGLKNNPLTIPQLATFAHKRVAINEEFRDIPTVTARIEEVPIGCEDKNR